MDQLLERVTAHAVRVEVLVPLGQVLDSRVEATRADLVEALEVGDPEAAVAIRLVAHRPVLHHVPGIVVKVGVRHPERPEDVLVGVHAQ